MLNQTAEYALRVMTSIALSQGAQPVRAKDLAKRINVPNHYLSKVLRKLVTAGLLRADRGHGGGFVLSQPPEKIKFIEVLNAVQITTEPKHCIFGWRQCNSKKPCILHHRWSTVSESFHEWAQATSLADVQRDARAAQWLISDGID
jgi:Rrf2 family protein